MDASEAPEKSSLASRVNHEWSRLSKAERVVARHLAASPPEQIMLATASDIARRAGTSDATVVRTARRLGYAGLPDLKNSLGAHASAGGPPQLSSRLEASRAAEDLGATARQIVDDALSRITRFGDGLDVERLAEALRLLTDAAEVFCYGWGVNEMSARYLALKLRRAGKRALASGATGFAFADDLLALTSRHTVVIFAPGRPLPDLRLLVAQARAAGAGLILVTEQPEQEIACDVDVVLREQGSPGGLTAEPLCSLLIADLLVLAVMAVDKDPAVNTYALLTRLRSEIVSGE
ncbi:MurR/RpiR family transcriptional regulator [Streptomyces sp. NRRL F-5126]|uniref:MurR/RpiR family transcriptional regulator n=1 Tax=Streptomyces sp. NRRL F-5126 TaxID=1463857 RepID=UPI0004C88F11|nr:MurR/RpiR family transcriptional regulator [Streptomyces sp. NRRL F-5126]